MKPVRLFLHHVMQVRTGLTSIMWSNSELSGYYDYMVVLPGLPTSRRAVEFETSEPVHGCGKSN